MAGRITSVVAGAMLLSATLFSGALPARAESATPSVITSAAPGTSAGRTDATPSNPSDVGTTSAASQPEPEDGPNLLIRVVPLLLLAGLCYLAWRLLGRRRSS